MLSEQAELKPISRFDASTEWIFCPLYGYAAYMVLYMRYGCVQCGSFARPQWPVLPRDCRDRYRSFLPQTRHKAVDAWNVRRGCVDRAESRDEAAASGRSADRAPGSGATCAAGASLGAPRPTAARGCARPALSKRSVLTTKVLTCGHSLFLPRRHRDRHRAVPIYSL